MRVCVDGLFSAPEQKGAVMNYSLDAKAIKTRRREPI